ncbi:MAG: hypothetical protein SGPRY_011892 [Prymnesium sp.]
MGSSPRPRSALDPSLPRHETWYVRFLHGVRVVLGVIWTTLGGGHCPQPRVRARPKPLGRKAERTDTASLLGMGARGKSVYS